MREHTSRHGMRPNYNLTVREVTPPLFTSGEDIHTLRTQKVDDGRGTISSFREI